MTLKSLESDLEKAKEGSRELDAMLYAFEHKLRRNSGTFCMGSTFQFEHPTQILPSGYPAALYVHEDCIPEYSSSLDSALALVGKVCPTLEITMRRLKDGNWQFDVYIVREIELALNICLALVKALALKEPDNAP